ncbi:MAG: penicillin-binding transpeptidase domain-containing protein [Desulfosudis oleivorans]|nr:penicillin-binding transpeptidase domain-containing protein [Desulfosudis oleivorans]
MSSREGGLRIFTTLDMHVQRTAEKALSGGIAGRSGTVQAACVILRPASGEILAMVGGRDYRTSQFNRAVSMRRSIGSLIKPVVYYTALVNGYTLSSMLDDSPPTVSASETDPGGLPANYRWHKPWGSPAHGRPGELL